MSNKRLREIIGVFSAVGLTTLKEKGKPLKDVVFSVITECSAKTKELRRTEILVSSRNGTETYEHKH